MNHKQKVKLARKMSKTKKEIAKKTPIFQTEQWEQRKKAKLKKQLNQGKKLCTKK